MTTDEAKTMRQAENRLRRSVARAGLTKVAPLTSETSERIARALTSIGEADTNADPGQSPVSAALAVIDADPELRALIDNPNMQEAPRDYSTLGEMIPTTTLALMVLSTYVNIERDKDGRWSFAFRVAPQSDGIKKALIDLARSFVR